MTRASCRQCLLLVAMGLVLAAPAAQQQLRLAGTWEATGRPDAPTLERRPAPTVVAPCDPDDAQIRLLRFFAHPPARHVLEDRDGALLLTSDDRFFAPTSLHADGREDRFSFAGADISYRTRRPANDVLVIEWRPQTGGTIVETYTLTGSAALLQVDQLIEHRLLSAPVRQRLVYRRAGPPKLDRSAGQTTTPVQEGVATDFRPPIDRPAFQTGTGPNIVIDEAHANFHTATGTYAPFADLFRRDGYNVRGSAVPLQPDRLRSVSVLVIVSPRQAPTGAEIAAVRDWVAAGGALLLVTDHPPFVRAAVNLGAAFGIRLRDEGAWDPNIPSGRLVFRRSEGTLKAHAITRGIDEVMTFSGSSLQIDASGQPLLAFGRDVCSEHGRFDPRPQPLEGQLQGAVLEFGQGRIAVFAEAGMFTAQGNSDGSAMGMNAPAARQNMQFLLNVMHWLTKVQPVS